MLINDECCFSRFRLTNSSQFRYTHTIVFVIYGKFGQGITRFDDQSGSGAAWVCQKQVDGEEMLGALAGTRGESVQFVADKSDADVLIVNTCGFINSAKEESIAAILDAVKRKQRGQISKVIVTGCLAQRYGSDLAKEIPEVDAFLGIESGPSIGNVVFGSRPRQINLVETVADKYPLIPQARLRATATPWTAYLKISEGCDHTCTFCAIPGIRGKHRLEADGTACGRGSSACSVRGA